MNTNRISSQRHNARVQYTPLTVSCSLFVRSSESPVAQEYNTFTGEYEPNRENVPCVIYPSVRAIDHDGSGFSRVVNHLLSIDRDKLVWYLDDKPIDVDYDERGESDFVVLSQANDNRGTILIYRNIAPNESHDLCFTGVFEDWRTGQIVSVQSEHIQLTTTVKAADEPALSFNMERFEYDPVYDTLLLYDYLISKGITDSSLLTHDKGKQYKVEIETLLTVGTTPVSTAAMLAEKGYHIQVVRKGTHVPLVPMSSSAPDLISVAYPKITFDARHIDRNEYSVEVLDEDDELYISGDIAIHRKITMPFAGTCKPYYEADIPAIQDFYFNKIFIPDIVYPECFYLIRWHTQRWHNTVPPTYDVVKNWQYGSNLRIQTSDIGIDHGSPDTVFDVWFDVDEHEVVSRATDESGDYLTDENGNILLIQ